jgi:hypothetical protein
MAIGEEVSRKI